MAYRINEDLCAGCAHCVSVCKFDAIEQGGDELTTFYHIDEEKCVSCGQCAVYCPGGLISFQDETGKKPIKKVEIIDEKCIGCSLCSRKCPVSAISGVIKHPFVVDQEKCIQCGKCFEACRKEAIAVEYFC